VKGEVSLAVQERSNKHHQQRTHLTLPYPKDVGKDVENYYHFMGRDVFMGRSSNRTFGWCV
jgi:hypothetical protein